jgi:hypothetical protein
VITVHRKPLATPPKEEEKPVVHTDSSELSKKLSSLQIGGNVIARKKYISF